MNILYFFFFFQAEDGIRDFHVTGVQTCALPILLPGQTPDEQHALVRSILGPGEYELEPIEAQGGTRSPIGGPLWDAVAGFVAEEEPAAAVVPICVPGFTDSHWVRDAFGT